MRGRAGIAPPLLMLVMVLHFVERLTDLCRAEVVPLDYTNPLPGLRFLDSAMQMLDIR